jgi:hypothetical protein
VASHLLTTYAVISGPLSLRKYLGAPCVAISHASRSITSSLVRELPRQCSGYHARTRRRSPKAAAAACFGFLMQAETSPSLGSGFSVT